MIWNWKYTNYCKIHVDVSLRVLGTTEYQALNLRHIQFSSSCSYCKIKQKSHCLTNLKTGIIFYSISCHNEVTSNSWWNEFCYVFNVPLNSYFTMSQQTNMVTTLELFNCRIILIILLQDYLFKVGYFWEWVLLAPGEEWHAVKGWEWTQNEAILSEIWENLFPFTSWGPKWKHVPFSPAETEFQTLIMS